jgi:MPBQ/MSBQ methyltransferase
MTILDVAEPKATAEKADAAELIRDAAPARRIAAKIILRRILRRALNPLVLFRAARMQHNRRANRHNFADAQLALFNKILPSDFLHYGYFEDLDCLPQDMKLSDISRAQWRYAEMLLDLIENPNDPVLDIGCGMGGLCRMMLKRGMSPTALTPDRLQALNITSEMPEVPLIRCKLERLPVAEHASKYGTVLTSESLQYLNLDRSLPILQTILKPGGRWIASDYFQRHPSDDPSCHNWDSFKSLLPKMGWQITYERDITENVIPMLSYVNMWMEKVGRPLLQLTTLRLQRKQPGLHHLMEGVIDHLNESMDDHAKRVDPAWFQRHRRYMMLVIERACVGGESLSSATKTDSMVRPNPTPATIT